MTAIIKSLYKLETPLSRDGISRTLKGHVIETGRTILVTQYDPKWITPQLAQHLIESAERIRNLDIPGVFTTIDCHYDGNSFFVMMDAPHQCAPMLSVLKQTNKHPFSQLSEWCNQIIEALYGLETHGLFHGNISLTNILVVQPSQTIGLIHPLTHAVYLASIRNQTDQFDSLPFWAPEQVSGNLGNRYADMYAVGVLMFVFYSNQWPYEFTQSRSRLQSVQFAPPRPFQPLNTPLAETVSQVIQHALSRSPEDRFSSFSHLKQMLIPPEPPEEPPLVIKDPVMTLIPPEPEKTGFSWTPRHTRIAVILGSLVVLAIIANFIYVSWVTGIPVSTVPQLKGKTPQEATMALAQVNLKAEIAGEKVDFSVPEGVVVESKPTANREVKEGRTVLLYIAKHAGEFLVPDLVGMTVSAARSTAPDAQFGYQVVGAQHSTTVPSGNIISQSPAAGSKAKYGGTITLIISKGMDVGIPPAEPTPSQSAPTQPNAPSQ